MEKYCHIKPKRKIWLFIGAVFLVATAIAVISQQWISLIIPALFLLNSVIFTVNDRVSYNSREVVLYHPLGKKYRFSWTQIVSTDIQGESRRRLGRYVTQMYLLITYYYDAGDTSRTETKKVKCDDYDGIDAWLAYYEAIKGASQD